MNHLIADVDATLVWSGGASATSTPVDIRNFLYFSFDFIALNDVDEGDSAVFAIQCAPASERNSCVPGVFADIPETVICSGPAEPGVQSLLVLEGPIAAGQRCKATIPCACFGFLRVVPGPGDDVSEDFQVIALTQGRKR